MDSVGQDAPPTDCWHEPPISRPIDVHRWSDYIELNDCLSLLVADIEGTEGRTRRRKPESAKRFRDAVRCIVLDLYVAWIADPSGTVGVPLGKDRFRPGGRYSALFLTYDGFKAAFDGLAALGYLQIVQKGYRYEASGNARVTRVRATTKLVTLLTGSGKLTCPKIRYRSSPHSSEPIVLRDKKKKRVSYTETNLTAVMRADVDRLNNLLTDHWLDLEITDAQMLALNARMTSDFRNKTRHRSSVDLLATSLRRIFNNSDWSQGGRFYGGWWQNIPKECRAYVTIDGKRTVEVDYSEMHPVMMYASVGAELVGDAYDIGLPNFPRALVKRAFNRLVNASGRMAPEANASDYGTTTNEIRAAIRTRHKPISQFLGTGEGIRLQNMDAEIANRIMQRFARMGYVCLPVHDSFIVLDTLESELRDIMNEEFVAQYGNSIKTKSSQAIDSPSQNTSFSSDGSDIAELLHPTGEYAGYETRLNDWNEIRGKPSGA